MKYSLAYNEEKNLLLQETRGIGFEDVIHAWEDGRVLDDLENKAHPNQRMLVVRMKNYIYAVPYVVDHKKKQIFMKTIYPSREMVKKYTLQVKKEEK